MNATTTNRYRSPYRANKVKTLTTTVKSNIAGIIPNNTRTTTTTDRVDSSRSPRNYYYKGTRNNPNGNLTNGILGRTTSLLTATTTSTTTIPRGSNSNSNNTNPQETDDDNNNNNNFAPDEEYGVIANSVSWLDNEDEDDGEEEKVEVGNAEVEQYDNDDEDDDIPPPLVRTVPSKVNPTTPSFHSSNTDYEEIYQSSNNNSSSKYRLNLPDVSDRRNSDNDDVDSTVNFIAFDAFRNELDEITNRTIPISTSLSTTAAAAATTTHLTIEELLKRAKEQQQQQSAKPISSIRLPARTTVPTKTPTTTKTRNRTNNTRQELPSLFNHEEEENEDEDDISDNHNTTTNNNNVQGSILSSVPSQLEIITAATTSTTPNNSRTPRAARRNRRDNNNINQETYPTNHINIVTTATKSEPPTPVQTPANLNYYYHSNEYDDDDDDTTTKDDSYPPPHYHPQQHELQLPEPRRQRQQSPLPPQRGRYRSQQQYDSHYSDSRLDTNTNSNRNQSRSLTPTRDRPRIVNVTSTTARARANTNRDATSSSRTRNLHTMDEIREESKMGGNATFISSNSAGFAGGDTRTDHPSSHVATNRNTTREWISILDAMRDTLERQETRIQDLEDENNLLRSQLNHRRMATNNTELDDVISTPSIRLQSPPPVVLSSRVQPTRTPNNNKTSRNRNDRTPVTPENILLADDDINAIDQSRSYDFDPSNRSNVTSRRNTRNKRHTRRDDDDDYDDDSRTNDNRRLQVYQHRSNGGSTSRTPPRLRTNRSYRDYDDDEDRANYYNPKYETIQIPDRDMFSPGTQFVEELSRVVDIQQGHYAPLSVIMDKHFARVSQIRSRNGWDRY